MTIRRMGVHYAVFDCDGAELCRFNQLADATLVFRYMSGQSIPIEEECNVLSMIRNFDENQR